MWDKVFDNGITLVSGASVLHIDMYAYVGKDLDASSPYSASYLQESKSGVNTTISDDDQGGYIVTVSSSIFDNMGIGLGDFYTGPMDSADSSSTSTSTSTTSNDNWENSIDLNNMPKLILEFRYFKDLFEGFVSGNLSFDSYYTGTGTDVNPFEFLNYRLITSKNDATNKYSSGMAQSFGDLTNEASTTFFPYSSASASTTPTIDLFSSSDYADAPTGTFDTSKTIANQCYVPGFAEYDTSDNLLYSKSTLLEISVDAEKLINYYWANPTAINSILNFGVSFKVNFRFANTPYYVS